ncbi:glycosyltransferase family A protein [uncultured Lutibacter sp.]|uniref:glycosyltransferase family 2 protein n=1 Tax=uncultured Lutibacter sp. TaxID=437739 RepID=UPI00263A27AF|nr:glycosyltransferase family A protein [uncultured Lutibacter sp.]
MNQSPLVSVIIPTYNRTSYLRETLNSVVNQSYSNIEIIVIDDGSSNDDSKLLCTQFEKVTYIKITNSGGPAKPRNTGIKAAKGKYIAFVDDDDLWLPNKVEQQVTVLEKNADFGLAHGYCELIDENSLPLNEIVGKPGKPDVKHGDVSLKMIGNWTLMTSSVLLRKELIDQVGFFNEVMPPAGEDVEFWVRCSFKTKFYFLNQPLVYYRKHNNNISASNQNYVKLPLYLKNVLILNRNSKTISRIQYKNLLSNLCKMQLKSFKHHKLLNVKQLFLLDSIWFLRFENLKWLLFHKILK